MTSKRRDASHRRVPRSSSLTTTTHRFPASRYLLFGGKGGVGKTTAATATALFLLAKASRNETILLLSTDPAHSLSDSLEIEIGDRLVQVKKRGGNRLLAYEMDASLALERFRVKHKPVLAQIAERGTFLDQSDINELLNLSLPGLDEVMSLFELTELDRASSYSRIVVDTAPSGHTSRMFLLPEMFKRMVYALDRMSDKHRYIIAHFARQATIADEVDLFLTDLNDRITRVRKLLFEDGLATFILVAIPEAMSVKETERYYDFLKQEHVPVKHLIVNRVEAEHNSCKYCRSRVKSQRPWLRAIRKTFAELDIHQVPLLPVEMRGVKLLHQLGSDLWMQNTQLNRVSFKLTGVIKKSKSVKNSQYVTAFPLSPNPIMIFGGKGGVGKTTAAAAFSLALAKANPKLRVLVFSTDPAHSLSDCFEEDIGQLKKAVAGIKNFDAVEVDPRNWFAGFRQRYRSWIDELFRSLQGSSKLEIKFDREAMQGLMELTPPGVDEIASLSTMVDLLEEKRYDTIVLDTAPTGHLVRLLELPQIALTWTRTFIKLLLKYQNVVHASHFAEELVSLSRSMKSLLAVLNNPNGCQFVAVAIAEKMSLEETLDMSKALSRLKIRLKSILINNVIPRDAANLCTFCALRRQSQDALILQFRKHFRRSVEFFLSTQQPGELRGKTDLTRHFDSWRLVAPEKFRQTNRATNNKRARRVAT